MKSSKIARFYWLIPGADIPLPQPLVILHRLIPSSVILQNTSISFFADSIQITSVRFYTWKREYTFHSSCKVEKQKDEQMLVESFDPKGFSHFTEQS